LAIPQGRRYVCKITGVEVLMRQLIGLLIHDLGVHCTDLVIVQHNAF